MLSKAYQGVSVNLRSFHEISVNFKESMQVFQGIGWVVRWFLERFLGVQTGFRKISVKFQRCPGGSQRIFRGISSIQIDFYELHGAAGHLSRA